MSYASSGSRQAHVEADAANVRIRTGAPASRLASMPRSSPSPTTSRWRSSCAMTPSRRRDRRPAVRPVLAGAASHASRAALRAWVHRQTGLELGYAEQLYTFGDRGRHAEPGDVSPHVVSIGYLALTQAKPSTRHAARRLAQLVSVFPVGRLAPRPPRILESDDRAAPARMGAPAQRAAATGCRQPAGSRAHVLRARRRGVGRREGSRPLRAAVRGRPRRGSRARRPRGRSASGTSVRASARRCASITAASWRPPSAACAPRSNIVR